MDSTRTQKPGATGARRPAARQSSYEHSAAELRWTVVPVCMHCDAVVLIEFPDGRRLWVPGHSDAARVLRQGSRRGPRPIPSHGVCRPCLAQHYPEFLPAMRARFPDAEF